LPQDDDKNLLRAFAYSLFQRLFNHIDDSALINQLLAPLEVGHEVDTAAKSYGFENPASDANSKQNFTACKVEKFGH
jgi:hypothetical protein